MNEESGHFSHATGGLSVESQRAGWVNEAAEVMYLVDFNFASNDATSRDGILFILSFHVGVSRV